GSGAGTVVSTTITNNRAIEIFNGQLYTSDSSGSTVRLGTVGTGLPTTAGQTITNLPGFPTSGSPYAFYFADLSGRVSGVDTLYVADDGAGLQKYSLVSGNWTLNNTIGTASDAYRGVTGFTIGSTVYLYATRKGAGTNAGGGELVALTDTSGYNANNNGSPTLLASAVTGQVNNTAFRGVAFVPGSAVRVSATGDFAK